MLHAVQARLHTVQARLDPIQAGFDGRQIVAVAAALFKDVASDHLLAFDLAFEHADAGLEFLPGDGHLVRLSGKRYKKGQRLSALAARTIRISHCLCNDPREILDQVIDLPVEAVDLPLQAVDLLLQAVQACLDYRQIIAIAAGLFEDIQRVTTFSPSTSRSSTPTRASNSSRVTSTVIAGSPPLPKWSLAQAVRVATPLSGNSVLAFRPAARQLG